MANARAKLPSQTLTMQKPHRLTAPSLAKVDAGAKRVANRAVAAVKDAEARGAANDVVVKDAVAVAQVVAVATAAVPRAAAVIEVENRRAAAMTLDATVLRADTKKSEAQRLSLSHAKQRSPSTGTMSLGISRLSNPAR